MGVESADIQVEGETILKRNPRSVWRSVDGKVVCLGLGREYVVHEFNDTAGRVWDLLEESRSVEDVARALGEEYDAPVEQIQQDLCRFLPTLVSLGFLEEDRQDTAAGD